MPGVIDETGHHPVVDVAGGVTLGDQDGLLDLIDQPVVLGMEDRVHTGEADVFVHAAIAGDVVRVEQLVVVGEIVSGSGSIGWALPTSVSASGYELAGRVDHRRGVVCNVDQELVSGAHGIGQVDPAASCRIAFHQHIISRAGDAIGTLHDDLREAMRAAEVVAILVGRQQRNIARRRHRSG